MPMVSITGEQQKVMDEALRERVKEKILELAAAEQAELDRLTNFRCSATNLLSLFRCRVNALETFRAANC